ncbi:MucBP domain-containing protein [Vagococcus sp.]|uniref:MucBP domain-containing protein n=1 Tax=Vagococcus sp. TaxID=1933889 RepID=UPI002FC8C38A
MRKKNWVLKIGVLLLLSCIHFTSVKVIAADPLTEFKDINTVDKDTKIAKGGAIPGDYSTAIRLTDESSYFFKGTKDDVTYNEIFKFGSDRSKQKVVFEESSMKKNPSKDNSVRLNKIGILNGEYIDLRINIGYKSKNDKGKGILELYVPSYKNTDIKEEFLWFSTSKGGTSTEVYFEYEFLKHETEERVTDYKGMWNFKRINGNKEVSINLDTSHALYVYENTSTVYRKDLNNDQLMYVTGSKLAGDDYRNEFTNLLNLPNGVFHTNMVTKNAGANFKYESDPITKLELGYPQIIGLENKDSDSREISYQVIQDMPKQIDKDFYPDKYEMIVKLDESIDVNSVGYEVKDVAGNIATSNFSATRDVATNTLILSVSEKTLESTGFIDNSYRVNLKGTLKPSFEKNKTKYFKDGYYEFPASVHYETNENKSGVSTGKAKLKAGISADYIRQTVGQGSKTTDADWKAKTISDLFTNMIGAYEGDDLVIESIESKTFLNKGEDFVDVTLKGSNSGLKKVVRVFVDVLELKSVKIHYLDQDGKEISPIVEETGFEKHPYDFTNKKIEIPNYSFFEVDEQKGSAITGIFGEPKEVNIYLKYQLNDQQVTVDYVDSEGNPIAPQFVDTLTPNKQHTFDAAVVPGYQVTSAKIDNVEITSVDKSKVNVPLKDKEVKVIFTYKSVHFTSVLDANPKIISPRGTIDYSLEVKSGMIYPQGIPAADYGDVSIAIQIDPNIDDVTDIKVVNASGEEVGTGIYTPGTGQLTASLNQPVKDTENLRVTYKATVNNTVVAKDKIKAKASVTAKYQVNGRNEVISSESNLVEVVVKDSDSKTINIHYVDDKGKEIKALEPESGKELQDYDFEAKTKVEIPGYTFVEVDEDKGLPIKGVLPGGAEAEDIYLVYKLAELDVKVKFVDETGAKISPDKSTTIISTNKKTIDSEVVPGYKLQTVKVDGVEDTLIDNSKVEIIGKTKPIEVVFVYQSVHFKMQLSSNTNVVPPNGTIKYTLTVTSGMKFKEGDSIPNYKDLAIKLPIDPKLVNITDIKVLDDKGEVIGKGTFDKINKIVDVVLTKLVKSTETLKLTYTATASNEVAPGNLIKTKAEMSAKYEINGAEKAISGKSNEVIVTVKSSEQKGVTIKYVDPKGNAIPGVDPDTEVGSELQPYDFTEKTKRKIPGYKFKEVDEQEGLPIKGTFGAGSDDEVIVIVYELDELPVTVNYVDGKSNNRKLWKSKKQDVKVASTFKPKAEQIPGFKVIGATVNDTNVEVSADGSIEFVMPEKATDVKFIYEPNHVKATIKANKDSATQDEEVKVTGTITSLMKYPGEIPVENYGDDFIVTINTKPANKNAKAISDVVLKTESGDDVTGKIETFEDYVTIGLSKKVKDTENLIVTFKTNVKDNGVTGEHIKYGLDVESSYKLYTDKADDVYESKVSATEFSDTLISGSVRLVEAPKTINFGELTFTGASQRLDNPIIDGKLAVVDSRKGSKNWSLQVSVPIPLKDGNLLLPAKLRYKTDGSDDVLSATAQDIYVNKKQQDRVVISDEWKKGGKGVSLEVDSKDMLKSGNYSGTIRWSVVEAEN